MKTYTLDEARIVLANEKRAKIERTMKKAKEQLKVLMVRALGVLLIAACLLMALRQDPNEDGTGFILCAIIGLVVALKPYLLLRGEGKSCK